jgi:hypothetical protein
LVSLENNAFIWLVLNIEKPFFYFAEFFFIIPDSEMSDFRAFESSEVRRDKKEKLIIFCIWFLACSQKYRMMIKH